MAIYEKVFRKNVKISERIRAHRSVERTQYSLECSASHYNGDNNELVFVIVLRWNQIETIKIQHERSGV